jgi:hypothetical protein
MTDEEFARHKRFLATELGALWRRYHNAMINFWGLDSQEIVSDKRQRELEVEVQEASKAFREKLMEIAGV